MYESLEIDIDFVKVVEKFTIFLNFNLHSKKSTLGFPFSLSKELNFHRKIVELLLDYYREMQTHWYEKISIEVLKSVHNVRQII